MTYLYLSKQLRFCLTLFGLLLTSFSLQASEHEHHNRYGSHGMVLFTDNLDNIYASHLPLYYKPHDYQLIYQVKITQPSLVLDRLKQGMVTILPKQFDLNRLINGESFSIYADYYAGHFERGGKQFYGANIQFEKMIMIEPIDKNYQARLAEFYTILITKKLALLVHKIQQAPSFDAIAIVEKKFAIEQAQVSCKKPKEINITNIRNTLSHCGIRAISYLETKDFAQ